MLSLGSTILPDTLLKFLVDIELSQQNQVALAHLHFEDIEEFDAFMDRKRVNCLKFSVQSIEKGLVQV